MNARATPDSRRTCWSTPPSWADTAARCWCILLGVRVGAHLLARLGVCHRLFGNLRSVSGRQRRDSFRASLWMLEDLFGVPLVPRFVLLLTAEWR
jgi:hypothetical protein